MPSIRANIVDGDDLGAVAAMGATFTQTSADSSNLPRHPPAIIRGAGVRQFCDHYFNRPGTVLAGGLYGVPDASIIADGLILKGNALLLSSRLMLSADIFPLEWSSPRYFDRNNNTISINLPQDRIYLPGVTVNVISLGWQVFGHWLVDLMPRIDRILRSGITVDRYLFGAPAAEWHYGLIEACGIPLEKCHFIDVETNVVDCDTVISPTLDRLYSEFHSDFINVHKRLRQKFAPQALPTRDIFIARSGWGGSKPLTNRARIENIAKDLGFEIIHPEKFSFAEQVNIFASARSVLGEMGSAMHSAVFSHEKTKICLIQSHTNLNFIQAQISRIFGHDIFYVLGHPEAPPAPDDQFYVDEMDVRHVAALLKDRP